MRESPRASGPDRDSLMRLGGIFVAICMVLIAGSGGAVAYFAFAVTPVVAAVVAAALLVSLAVYNAIAQGLRTSAAVGGQIAELSRTTSDLGWQIAELGRRVATLEAWVETSLPKPPPAPPAPVVEPLAGDVEEVGTLVRHLADAVAAHETRIAELAQIARTALSPLPSQPAIATESPPLQAPPPPAAIEAKSVEATPAEAPPAKDEAQEAMLATIRDAIASNRVDVYLQPIVTLPQRRTRYYEALARLRSERGEVISAIDFIKSAEHARLLPQIDNLMVFRCVQVVRRLLARNREVGLFCNISASTLADPVVFTQLVEFLDANRAIASSIILEFNQGAIRDAGPLESESLEALAERGFRFSLDNVSDLRIEPRVLATRGFRFVKVSGSLLLRQEGGGAGDIHPADLADLLARFGIEMIAEKVDSEAMVVDLLDFDVRYGQGYLFSPPRPVRAEALQGAGERTELIEPAPPAVSAPAPKPARTSGLAQLARRV